MEVVIKELIELKNGDIKAIVVIDGVENRFLTNTEQLMMDHKPPDIDPYALAMPVLSKEYKRLHQLDSKITSASFASSIKAVTSEVKLYG